jgi:hypothetical protein
MPTQLLGAGVVMFGPAGKQYVLPAEHMPTQLLGSSLVARAVAAAAGSVTPTFNGRWN